MELKKSIYVSAAALGMVSLFAVNNSKVQAAENEGTNSAVTGVNADNYAQTVTPPKS